MGLLLYKCTSGGSTPTRIVVISVVLSFLADNEGLRFFCPVCFFKFWGESKGVFLAMFSISAHFVIYLFPCGLAKSYCLPVSTHVSINSCFLSTFVFAFPLKWMTSLWKWPQVVHQIKASATPPSERFHGAPPQLGHSISCDSRKDIYLKRCQWYWLPWTYLFPFPANLDIIIG